MRVLVLGALLAACASRPVPAPEGRAAAVIGMRIWVDSPARGTYGTRNQPASGVVFVRISEKGDPTRVGEVIESNYAQGATVYLFNAEPGRYAAVAAFRQRDGRKVYSFFSEALIRKTLVDVKPRSTAFAGTLRISVSYNTSVVDDAQNHYFRLIAPEVYTANLLERLVARTDAEIERRHDLKRDAEAEAAFRDRARSLFTKTSWMSRLSADG